MKIRTTLTAGCFVFALITGMVGFLGERAITRISGEFDAVADEVLPIIETLEEIRYAGARVVSSTMECAFMARGANGDGAGGSCGIAEAAVIKESGGALYRDAVARLRAFSVRLDPEERALMADIERSGDRLLATSDEFMKVIGRRGSPALLAELRERFEREERHFHATVTRAHVHEKEELAETKAEVRSSINGARFTLFAASSVALVLAIFGGSLVAVLITRPIGFLREGVERVRKGLLDTSIPVAANNEIGLLATAFNRMTGDLRAAEEEIRQLAYFDPLTGLPNRSLFLDRLTQALEHARRSGERVALLFLDLDRFKDVNDTLGHASGDQLLAAVAERLRGHLRASDTLARIGGDEFVAILTGVREARDAGIAAQTTLDMLTYPFTMEGKEIFISTSVGIALFPDDAKEGDALFRHADMALYAAKDKGRNAYSFFAGEMNLKARDRRGLEESLRRALAGGEFYLEYQPQVDLRSGRVFGVEALLRWRHPEEGIVLPGRFIPVAEETGLIRPIGEWVLRSACLQGRKWEEGGRSPIRVAVNVSGHQFNQPGFIDMVDRVLEETGLDPTLLELELTESTLMEGANETIMTLIDLKVRGVHLAIDDFGTGYSSLSYLKHFPIDRLKIDRSFVRDIATDLDDCAIVEAIIAMAHSLGRRVLAEGVERAEELAFLVARGCDEAQGYHFGRPMGPEELERLLAAKPAERRLDYLGAGL